MYRRIFFNEGTVFRLEYLDRLISAYSHILVITRDCMRAGELLHDSTLRAAEPVIVRPSFRDVPTAFTNTDACRSAEP